MAAGFWMTFPLILKTSLYVRDIQCIGNFCPMRLVNIPRDEIIWNSELITVWIYEGKNAQKTLQKRHKSATFVDRWLLREHSIVVIVWKWVAQSESDTVCHGWWSTKPLFTVFKCLEHHFLSFLRTVKGLGSHFRLEKQACVYIKQIISNFSDEFFCYRSYSAGYHFMWIKSNFI